MKEFKGVITPMVTPFKEDEEIDWELLDQHVEFLIAKGVHCLAPTGSTGEFESLTFDEVIGIYQAVVKKVAGRVPVIGGMGGRSTRESIAMARAAEKAGVDGLLVLPPYYYGFNQEEIIAYYQQIADSTSLLIMLYNNPGKTKVMGWPRSSYTPAMSKGCKTWEAAGSTLSSALKSRWPFALPKTMSQFGSWAVF